jgi:AcrR family transcriptional regulator
MSDGEIPREARGEVATAVQRALAKHGYARLTTAKVAAESELSEAGLYYHYDTKDDMIVAFLREAEGYLAEELAAFDDSDRADSEVPEPEARLRAAVDFLLVDPADEERAGVNVAMMELLSHAPYNDALREHLVAMERHVLGVLTDIVADGVESGVFRDVDPEATAALLLAATDGSTGIDIALDLGVGDGIRSALHDHVDCLLAE